MSVFDSSYWNVTPTNKSRLVAIQQRIDNKTKPPGSLGRLEALASQLALIQCTENTTTEQINIHQPTIVVFAADHGIAKQGVSIAPQAVTRQMVLNFLHGGAAINCFCEANQVALKVVDAGILQPIDTKHKDYFVRRIQPSTADFSVYPAMSRADCELAIHYGAEIARSVIAEGANVLAFGEMGIGNTSSASALLSLALDQPVTALTGFGTGITPEQRELKCALLEQAIERVLMQHGESLTAEVMLREVGGFEIVQMVGAILATAAAGKTLVIDGFIVSVAALFAVLIAPDARDYMVFSHRSAESAHGNILEALNAEPLLELELRLGEGTGAALAMPLLRAAAHFYNHMATFDSANVVL